MPSALRKFTACDVADALTALGLRGTLPYLRQRSGPTSTFAGKAYTVEYAPLDDPRPALKSHYVDSVPKDSVLLIGTSVPLPYAPYTALSCALYGGLMSTRCSFLGAAATVVLGSVRDTREHIALNYPVFSYDVGVQAPNGVAKVVAANAPLKCNEVTVHPGDYVVADVDGVAVIPQAKLDDVLEYMPRRTRADELAAEDIKSGVPAATAQKQRRKDL